MSASDLHSAVMACLYSPQSRSDFLSILNARSMQECLLAGSGSLLSRHLAHFLTASGPASTWSPIRYERFSLSTIASAIWPYTLDASAGSPRFSNSSADLMISFRSTYSSSPCRVAASTAAASLNALATSFP